MAGKKKSVKKRGGGMMMQKMRGGGMMGPKKKMAKGGALKKARARKPSGRLTVADLMNVAAFPPTGRSAAAIKASMKGVSTPGSKLMTKIRKGKGNPAGKDLSMKGRLTALMRAAPQTGRLGKKGLGRLLRKGAGKKKK